MRKTSLYLVYCFVIGFAAIGFGTVIGYLLQAVMK
jgi:hypothetical protein